MKRRGSPREEMIRLEKSDVLTGVSGVERRFRKGNCVPSDLSPEGE